MSSMFPSVANIMARIQEPHAKIHGGATEINQVWQKNNEEAKKKALDVLENVINPTLVEITSILNDARNETNKLSEQVSAEMLENTAFSEKVTAMAVIVAFLCTALLGYKISNGILLPLKMAADLTEKIGMGDVSERLNLKLNDEIGLMAKSMDKMADALEIKSKLAERVAEGDLTVSVELASDKDNLGIALKTMIDSLTQTLSGVRLAAEEVDSGAGQVSEASQSLSQGATESAASLEEISSSVTEIGSQTKANAENATQANTLATQTRKAAESGNQKMSEMMGAMTEIQNSSKQIAKIIKVIDDIAFQTNLLALNAAVEAARAGRHGKGFAVVADEVRNLASRSAKAAKETSEMIEGSVEKVQNGTRIASATEQALQEIVASSVKVADLVGEIAAASNEQAQGILEIGQGLEQIDKVSQQNTANAEETAAASEELSGQARELNRLLEKFQLRGQENKVIKTTKRASILTKTRPENRMAPKKSSQAKDGKDHSKQKALHPSDVIALDDDELGRY
ncbi:MAG: HAMP domain-containing protein [Candidatus Riflebacteria bacterium]|nr:HAMP domain-containing protein [Candidatus Riflebacteria bacterium]